MYVTSGEIYLVKIFACPLLSYLFTPMYYNLEILTTTDLVSFNFIIMYLFNKGVVYIFKMVQALKDIPECLYLRSNRFCETEAIGIKVK